MGKRKSIKPELEPALSSPENAPEAADDPAAAAGEDGPSLAADSSAVDAAPDNAEAAEDAAAAPGTALVLFAPVTAADIGAEVGATPSDRHPARLFGLAQMAAAVAVAAIGGILVGGVAMALLPSGESARGSAPVALRAVAEPSPEQQQLADLASRVAQLTSRLDAATASMDRQFASLGSRFDRAEKQQATQGESLASLGQAIAALPAAAQPAPVVPVAAQPSNEITGSITPQRREARPQTLDDWIVVDVYRGRALVDGRRFGVFEVEPGSTLPGAGQVRSIERQDGRWVVVTRRGIITSRLEEQGRRF